MFYAQAQNGDKDTHLRRNMQVFTANIYLCCCLIGVASAQDIEINETTAHR